ncbi:MAG: amino acid permease [Terrimicrobiaceae bacterium]|nr:amino acid permease [Terrimicrobiaceae bacterium]
MQRVGFWVCATMVFASMVGTGVFTSLGFQVGALPSPFVILVLWGLGGVIALCGALSYAELAAALPRSGGEYHFLGRIYHPALGVMAGFVSVFVGFSAPIALGAIAFGRYIAAAWPAVPPWPASFVVIIGLAAIHSRAVRVSGVVQVAVTSFKALLILGFIVAGSLAAPGADFRPQSGDAALIVSAPFAVSLLFVLYAYSGWNSAVYIAGEVRNPGRTLPLALGLATVAVTFLYVALNAVFLASAPAGEFAGKVEVGQVAARHLFGEAGGRIMSAVIGLGLISSLSALTWAGPRVAQTAGQDFPALRWFAKTSETGIPHRALFFQTAIVLGLVATASFEAVLVYAQFALVVCSLLTVFGLFVLRVREPALSRPFRCPGFPIVPAIFVAGCVFTVIYTCFDRPIQATAGALTLLAGLGLYFAVRGRK